MFTDIVGSAALEQSEEVAERISELVRGRVGEHGGDFVHQGDDETFSTFPTALGAVSCAVAIQQVLRGEASLVLRIGVHLGDLSTEPSGKDAAFVCAAIASTTAPAGVRISAPVFEELAGRLRLGFTDLGAIALQDIPKRVQVYAVHPVGERSKPVAASVERRLAAILEADVVSYSRLIATDEDWTVGAIGRHRATFGRHVREGGGRVIDTAGDGVLAEFNTALDAVECAIAVQSKLREENMGLPAVRAIQYRIGIELGDVRVERDRIYGSAVNVAARLEALARPGGVCISGAVWDQIRYQIAQPFEDLGRQSLKNIPYAVHAHTLRPPGTSPSPCPRSRWAIGLLAAFVGLLSAVAWIALRD
jgi:class 3 adenylate cyclase